MQQVQKLVQMQQADVIKSQSRERVEAMKVQSSQAQAASRLEQQRMKTEADLLTHAADQHFTAVHDHALAGRQEVHEHNLATREQVHTMLNAAAAPPAPGAQE